MSFAPPPVGLDSPEVVTLRLIACTLEDRARRTTSVAPPLTESNFPWFEAP